MNESVFTTKEQQVLLKMFKEKIIQVCDQMNVPNSFKFQALYLFNEVYLEMKLGTHAPVLVSAAIIYITSKITEMHINLDQLCKDLRQPLETLLTLELQILELLNFKINFYWIEEKKNIFIRHVSRLVSDQTSHLQKYLDVFKQHFVYYQTNLLKFSLEQRLNEEQIVLFIFKYSNRMDRNLFVTTMESLSLSDDLDSLNKLVDLLEREEEKYLEHKKLDEYILEGNERGILKDKLKIWNN
eukprot:GAHX01002231.1.p1 GENE.GAHX01002231.1~~GAHX01002231.1.p1  ORF type:complete len:241 (+),score=54.45 GAHX01002231.1:40-762(+)